MQPTSTNGSPSTMACRFSGADDATGRRPPACSQQGRGGFLGMAVFLTKNSQPQRTSPVKRGFWVVHKLLGEHIPAAARQRRRVAGQGNRYQRQEHPRVAGAAHGECDMRSLPSALRPDRPVDGRVRSDRQEPDQRPGGPAHRQSRSPALGRGSRTAFPSSRSIWRPSGSTNSPRRCAASFSAIALGRSLELSDRFCWKRCKPSWKRTTIAS